MFPIPYREDINNLGIVLYLLEEGEIPPVEWLDRLLDLGLLAPVPDAAGGFAITPKGVRYLP